MSDLSASSSLSSSERVVLRALRLLGAMKEPALALHLGTTLNKLRPLCRSLEDRDYIIRDTQQPIRWRLTYEGNAALDQNTGEEKEETEGDNGNESM